MKKKITLLLLIFFNFSLVAQNTTTLVVSGQGNTQLEAQHNALRSAIEQASGAFISSNTEILNDEVIKDEIISITNGNIQEFNIISEIKIPNGEYAITLKATVSLQKLVSFINNKGGQAELKGGLFAANVKQQILNEENEVKTIRNMCSVLDEIAAKMFRYDLKVNEPSSISKDNTKWQVELEVNVGLNDNSLLYAEYMYNTLVGLKLSKEEISNYIKLNKEVFPVSICGNTESTRRGMHINLRSNESIQLIINQLLKIKNTLLDFNIDNEIRPIKGSNYNSVIDYQHYSILLFNNRFINYSVTMSPIVEITKGTLFSNPGVLTGNQSYYQPSRVYVSLSKGVESFFNSENRFYITYNELRYKYGHEDRFTESTERVKRTIFSGQFRMLGRSMFYRKCRSRENNKSKYDRLVTHHLGLVISFANFTDSYFVTTYTKEFDQEGRQIDVTNDITEFKYLATLIFKHNLTIEQIEQIDKYEISK